MRTACLPCITDAGWRSPSGTGHAGDRLAMEAEIGERTRCSTSRNQRKQRRRESDGRPRRRSAAPAPSCSSSKPSSPLSRSTSYDASTSIQPSDAEPSIVDVLLRSIDDELREGRDRRRTKPSSRPPEHHHAPLRSILPAETFLPSFARACRRRPIRAPGEEVFLDHADVGVESAASRETEAPAPPPRASSCCRSRDRPQKRGP